MKHGPSCGAGSVAVGMAAGAWALAVCAGVAMGQPGGTPPGSPEPAPATGELRAGPTEADGHKFTITGFTLEFAREHPGLPGIERLMDGVVELGKTDEGLVAARPGLNVITVPFREVTGPAGGTVFFESGVRAVAEAVVRAAADLGLAGMFVAPHPEDIDEATGDDLREGRTTLRLVVFTPVVRELRTVASGEVVPTAERIDHPRYARILARSPIQPGDLLRRDVLDDYVFRLNRRPGRRVDVAVAPATKDPGDAALDFLVSESKPWRVYFQLSNTGNKSTNEWRERFGFVHHQLTNHDDMLRVEYVTGGFKDSNAVTASYLRPISNDRLDLRVYGSWAEFDASDVGASGQSFDGDNFALGAELSGTILQRGPVFIDLFGGARFENVRVRNSTTDTEGEDRFFIPYIGLRAERTTEEATLFASVQVEGNVAGIAGTDEAELTKLGRQLPDEEWIALKWDVEYSFYLEPLIDRKAWRGESKEGRGQTLAHEVWLALRGQYAVDSRLIPTYEQVAGGFYTVRGYPESVVAGDSGIVASAEYRFHLPRFLKIEPDPNRTRLFGRAFRWTPTSPYGRADWDLIFRGFVDAGATYNNKRRSFEKDETLFSTGVGVELQFRQNMFARLDWGLALSDESSGTEKVESGDSRLHFSFMLMY